MRRELEKPGSLELRQRYQLTGDIATNIETAMEENQYVLQDVFRQRWSTHRCNIDGCGSVIVIGNFKKNVPRGFHKLFFFRSFFLFSHLKILGHLDIFSINTL